MRGYKNERTGEPLSETYISHCHKLIKAIYNYAKKKKWVLSNPADYVLNPPKIKSVERDYYSYDEMLEVYDLLENYDIRFKTAITLLFNTGLRRGELFGLKWKDVVYRKIPIIENWVRTFQNTTILKINKEVITVSKKVMQEKDFSSKYNIIEIITDTLVAIKPKTEKSIRNIVVVEKCYDLLQEYKQFQIDNGFIPSDEDYIFRTLDNANIWNPGYLTREWESFLKENVLKKITIHDIRHSHATYLLSLGVPPQDVARRSGHSEPTMTLKIYTHSNLLQDQKIANMIAQNVYYGYERAKEETISPEIVLKLFLTEHIDISDESLYSSVEWICNNKNINVDEIDDYLKITKKHIFENNNSLEPFVSLINSLSLDERKILLDGINNIFNINNPLKLKKNK